MRETASRAQSGHFQDLTESLDTSTRHLSPGAAHFLDEQDPSYTCADCARLNEDEISVDPQLFDTAISANGHELRPVIYHFEDDGDYSDENGELYGISLATLTEVPLAEYMDSIALLDRSVLIMDGVAYTVRDSPAPSLTPHPQADSPETPMLPRNSAIPVIDLISDDEELTLDGGTSAEESSLISSMQAVPPVAEEGGVEVECSAGTGVSPASRPLLPRSDVVLGKRKRDETDERPVTDTTAHGPSEVSSGSQSSEGTNANKRFKGQNPGASRASEPKLDETEDSERQEEDEVGHVYSIGSGLTMAEYQTPHRRVDGVSEGRVRRARRGQAGRRRYWSQAAAVMEEQQRKR